ncbi:hypothetical protein [Parasphingorhabdus pacifica]
MTAAHSLPMAWLYVASADGPITVRWGRGDGFLTVHSGDRRGEHSDGYLVDTVRVGGDWRGDEDIAAQARKWLTRRAGKRAR